MIQTSIKRPTRRKYYSIHISSNHSISKCLSKSILSTITVTTVIHNHKKIDWNSLVFKKYFLILTNLRFFQVPSVLFLTNINHLFASLYWISLFLNTLFGFRSRNFSSFSLKVSLTWVCYEYCEYDNPDIPFFLTAKDSW